MSRDKLNVTAALATARAVERTLGQFATEVELQPAPLQVPQEWLGLNSFCESVRRDIIRLRREVPAAKEQEELVGRRGKIIDLKFELDAIADLGMSYAHDIRELDKKHSGKDSVDVQLAQAVKDIKEEKARYRAMNARANLIGEAIKFLEAEVEKDRLSDLCPLCGNEHPP